MAEHFFTEGSDGFPVLFFVDEEVLGQVYGAEPLEAVDSITEVVWRRLGRAGDHNGYFHEIERKGRQWKLAGGEGIPPFLDLLAVCVLAATRMGTGDVAPNNYYHQLRELLYIDEPGTPRGFADSLDYLWTLYTWWLDDVLAGTRGISTVVDGGRLTHVGKPLSQTLFLGSDIRRLDEFFRWIHLEPSEDIEEDFLVTYFKAWAPGRNISPGAKQLLADDQYWPTLGRILSTYAHQWDGTRSDREGIRMVALRVVVLPRMPRRISIRAKQADGYPDRVGGELGGSAAAATADGGLYVVDGTPDPRQLLRGGTLGDEFCRLTLAPSDLFVLQLEPDFGGWVSVTSFVPGERHYVLASPAVADTVWNQLSRLCAAPPIPQPSLSGAFGAWGLYGDVVLQGNEELAGVLADYRPTLRHRFTFSGGLPLEAHRSYLSGGAPDVWFPSTADDSLWLTLDGRRINTLSDKVSLSRELPEEETASHVVGYGEVISRTISLIDSVALTPPPHEQPGHLLELGDDDWPTSHEVLARVEDAPEGSITVVGPHVEGAGDRWSEPPVLLHRHATRAWLLGQKPGEVLAVEKPPKPAWMVKKRLTGHLYEARAPFTVQYSIEEWPSGEVKACQRATDSPGELGSDGASALWTELILAAQLGSGDPDLWDEYRMTAELLELEVSGS